MSRKIPQLPRKYLPFAFAILAIGMLFNIGFLAHALITGGRWIGRGETRRYIELATEPTRFHIDTAIGFAGTFVTLWLFFVVWRQWRERNE